MQTTGKQLSHWAVWENGFQSKITIADYKMKRCGTHRNRKKAEWLSRMEGFSNNNNLKYLKWNLSGAPPHLHAKSTGISYWMLLEQSSFFPYFSEFLDQHAGFFVLFYFWDWDGVMYSPDLPDFIFHLTRVTDALFSCKFLVAKVNILILT